MDKLVEEANLQIQEVCKELSDFLCRKNASYSASAFKKLTYAGRTIEPEDTINVRIVDKIRRLSSTNPDFDGEDAELDLIGYLVIKRANRRLQNKS